MGKRDALLPDCEAGSRGRKERERMRSLDPLPGILWHEDGERRQRRMCSGGERRKGAGDAKLSLSSLEAEGEHTEHPCLSSPAVPFHSSCSSIHQHQQQHNSLPPEPSERHTFTHAGEKRGFGRSPLFRNRESGRKRGRDRKILPFSRSQNTENTERRDTGFGIRIPPHTQSESGT